MAKLTYGDYLRVPQLLDQQHCLAKPPAHDELQFIIVHQVYELWFKLILHELDAVQAALAGDDAATARRLARRVVTILDVLVRQIHVLESMRPVEFLVFRERLQPASGFQSVQFREIECLLGLKDPELVKLTVGDPRLPELERRLSAEDIPTALYGLMRRKGLDVTPPGPDRGEEQATATLDALRDVYEHPDDHAEVYELCETLLDVDEQVILWRRHHVMMVARQIGAKPGTGKGTTGDLDGLRYLKTTLDKRALPDLWAVRTRLDG